MHSKEDAFAVKRIVHHTLQQGLPLPDVVWTLFKLDMNDWRGIITWPPMYLTNSSTPLSAVIPAVVAYSH